MNEFKVISSRDTNSGVHVITLIQVEPPVAGHWTVITQPSAEDFVIPPSGRIHVPDMRLSVPDGFWEAVERAIPV